MSNHDHLSVLPVHLVHKIMSFLPPLEALKFLTLSKTLSFSWLTSPTICLDFIAQSHQSQHSFFDHTRLTLRRHCNNTHIQTLIFRYTTYGNNLTTLCDSTAYLLDELLSFASENSISSLYIACHFCSWFRPFSASVFSSRTIRFLDLFGLTMPAILTVDCPLLEDLKISACGGVKTIQFSRDSTRVKGLTVLNCREVAKIRVGESQFNFVSFTYVGSYFPREIEIDRERFECLRVRRNLMMDDDWVRNNLGECVSLKILELFECVNLMSVGINNLSECHSLEILQLWDCVNVPSVRLSHSRLRCLKLNGIESIKNIDLALPSLECLELNRFKRGKSARCKVYIGGCTSLKSVKFGHFFLSKQLIVNDLASTFSSLESLTLESCYYAKSNGKTRFRLENLKRLELICWTLVGLQFECPNLVCFKYSGIEFGASPVVIFSRLRSAGIRFQTSSISCDKTSLKNHLSFFRRCNTLFLAIDEYKENFIIPEQLRNGLIRPPNELKHLQIPIGCLWKTQNIVEFLDSLLWLALRPETISFVDHVYTVQKKEKLILKLYYHRGDAYDVRDRTCCETVKCWRHGLREVVMENLADHHREILQNYFAQNTKALITFV